MSGSLDIITKLGQKLQDHPDYDSTLVYTEVTSIGQFADGKREYLGDLRDLWKELLDGKN